MSSDRRAANEGKRRLRTAAPRVAHNGFSLFEVTLVAGLTSIMLLMMSGFSMNLGRSMSDTIAQARLASEANLAIQALRRDFRGSLPGTELGSREVGLAVGQVNLGGNRIWICYDGAPANGTPQWTAPDRVVQYLSQNNQLLRIDAATGATFVVADNVSAFTVTNVSGGLRINLTFTYRDFSRSYTIEMRDP